MTEDPTFLARDANDTHHILKGLLNEHDPYDKDVEFHRKKLRRHYLQLLLTYPRAPESKDVENHLWMQTSYAFITEYKKKVNELDRINQNNARLQQQQQQGQPPQQRHVEYRKLLQRFRQFLAEEEKFWMKLVGRLYRTFALDEARPALVKVGVPLEDELGALAQAGAGNPPQGRNQQQFPPEESSPRFEAETPAEKEARMFTLSRALVCLGDVARYRELYNESGGRPKAGHEDGAPARKRNKKGPAWVENMAKARNYEKAQHCYEQAKLLVPDEGKPSNQLAILASYRKDAYTSLAHYYHALCVKQPCDTALNNMRNLLTKTLDIWRIETRQDKNRTAPLDPSEHPGFRVDKFKQRVVVLHGLWRVGSENGIEKMNSIARRLDSAIFRDFATLVSQRQMPADMITQAIAMAQGALWKHRMVRDAPSETQQDAFLEWLIAKHVLDMHSALLEIGRDEVRVPPSHDTKDDLGQQITATFRRTLPGLRVASKWLRANVKYLAQDPEFRAHQLKKKGTVGPQQANKISCYSNHTRSFWELYAEFSRTLARTFPLVKLPKLTSPLEEDGELRGFLPLKKLMGDVPTDEQGKVRPREEVHPNDEQLMRIADLLEDARAIAEQEYAPIQYYSKSGIVMLDSNAFEVESQKIEVTRAPPIQIEPATPHPPAVPFVQADDDNMDLEDSLSDISPDDDEDVVRNAFRHLDAGNQEEEDEQIVYDPRPRVSPVRPTVSPPAPTSPVSPPRPPVPATTMLRTPTQSPSRMNGTSPRAVVPTTAEDLLKNMGFNRSPKPLSAAPQPSLAFSPSSARHPTQSIWSASRDEQKMMAGVGQVSGSPLYHSPTHQYSSLAAPAHTSELPSLSQQSIWGAPVAFTPGGLESTQQSLHGNATSGGLGPSPFLQNYTQAGMPPSNGINGGRNGIPQHKRAQSFAQPSQMQQQPQYQFSPSHAVSLSTATVPQDITMGTDSSLVLATDGVGNYPGVIGSSRDLFYNSNYQTATSTYHTRNLSYGDPRLGHGMPQQSSVWGNR